MEFQAPVKFGTPLLLSKDVDEVLKAGDFVTVLDIVDYKLRVFSPTLRIDRLISLCQEKGRIDYEFFPVQLAFAANVHSLQGDDLICVPVFVQPNN